MDTLLTLFFALTSVFSEPIITDSDGPALDVAWAQGDVSVAANERPTRAVQPGDVLRTGEMLFMEAGAIATVITQNRHVIPLRGPLSIAVEQLLDTNFENEYPVLPRIPRATEEGQWPGLKVRTKPRTNRQIVSVKSPRGSALKTVRPWIEWTERDPLVGIDLVLEEITPDGLAKPVENWKNVRTERFQFSVDFREGSFYRITTRSQFGDDRTTVYILTQEEQRQLRSAEEDVNKLFASLDLSVPERTVIRARWLDDHSIFGRAAQWWLELAYQYQGIEHFNRRLSWHESRVIIAPKHAFSTRAIIREFLHLLPSLSTVGG